MLEFVTDVLPSVAPQCRQAGVLPRGYRPSHPVPILVYSCVRVFVCVCVCVCVCVRARARLSALIISPDKTVESSAVTASKINTDFNYYYFDSQSVNEYFRIA